MLVNLKAMQSIRRFCAYTSISVRTWYISPTVQLSSTCMNTKRQNKRSFSTMAPAFPVVSVNPTRGLMDEKIQVSVSNVPPRSAVTLHSLHQSEDNSFWEAFGHYYSDELGSVSVSDDASVGGTYEGTESMGLLWSMKPVPGSRTGLRFRKMNVLSPMVVHISVYSGHITEGFNTRSPLATVVLERWYLAPGVCRIEIRDDEVKGTLFIPPGPGCFPGVLDLWGGSGGLVESRSGLLASHGFASLALEYISVDRPPTLQYRLFEKAFRVVQDHPLVMKEAVALFGLSLGTSISLCIAAYSKDITPRCCVFVNGGHTPPVEKKMSYAFTKSMKIAYKNNIDKEGSTDFMLPIPFKHGEKVDMGRIKCPLMMIVGEDDQSWPTAAEDMTQMMRAAGNDHLLTMVRYPGAGHLIEPPYTPHVMSSAYVMLPTKEKVIMMWGGSPKPHADAQEDSWEKVLRFLRQQLSQPLLSPLSQDVM